MFVENAEMPPRLRRLRADYEQVTAAYADHARIRVVDTEGEPPEKYVIEYRVTGLVPLDGCVYLKHRLFLFGLTS